MAKVYEGVFGIRANAKGEVVLGKPPTNGTVSMRARNMDVFKYTAADAAEVLKRVQAIAKEQKLVARIFKPDPKATEPVVLADKWGNPYLALLPKKLGTVATKQKTTWFD